MRRHAGDLVVEVDAQQSAQGEIVVLDLDIGLVDAAVCSLDDGHGMLRDRIGGIGRNTQDLDAVFLCGFRIDIVETGAAQQDQADAAFSENLDDFAGSFIVDENADSVEAFCKMGGLDGQSAAEISDVYIVSSFALVLGEFTEEEAVIIFCAVEGDAENIGGSVLGSDFTENTLDDLNGLVLVRTFRGDIENGTFFCLEGKNLQDILAGSRFPLILKGHVALDSGAGLCQQCRGTGMDAERIFYSVL